MFIVFLVRKSHLSSDFRVGNDPHQSSSLRHSHWTFPFETSGQMCMSECAWMKKRANEIRMQWNRNRKKCYKTEKEELRKDTEIEALNWGWLSRYGVYKNDQRFTCAFCISTLHLFAICVFTPFSLAVTLVTMCCHFGSFYAIIFTLCVENLVAVTVVIWHCFHSWISDNVTTSRSNFLCFHLTTPQFLF